MAFSFSNSGGDSAFGANGFGSTTGMGAPAPAPVSVLEEIAVEGLGFNSFNGEAKLKILPQPWPSDDLPPTTSSLLSVASNKGLLAAAGPSSVIVASTEAVRKAFEGKEGGDFRAFMPQLTLPIGTRISQVAFSSDGNLLVLSAESGGGLAIYDVQGLVQQGNTQSTFELATNGVAIRALVPNPAPSTAELFAVVTVNGDLLIANMKSRQFVSGADGQAMKGGVTCASWSVLGKQLVAGLGDGCAYQMKPDGVGVAEIPRPAGLEGDQHVSAITWLERNVFLVAHTPTRSDDVMSPSTTYHIITRQPTGSSVPFVFQRLPEVCSPFGMLRPSPIQYIKTLKDFPPNLKDMIIVSSTASQDIGLFTRSTLALTNDVAAEKITNVFTTTGMANDSRRAQLPMTEDFSSDTSTIGMALDLSSLTNVFSPIPGDEIEQSRGPLPALLILTNEGTLCGWWISYSDSIRQGESYPGLTVNARQEQKGLPNARPSPSPIESTPAPAVTPAFAQSSFAASPSPTFGTASKPVAPAFGTTSRPGAFGAPSAMGAKQSPWGGSGATPQASGGAFGQSAFGQPSFGSNKPATSSTQPAFGATSSLGTAGTSAFGSTGSLGAKSSPWGTPSMRSPAATGAVFGQSSNLSTPKPFGSGVPTSTFGLTSTATIGGGFSSFASSGGFAAAASPATPQDGGGNIFKTMPSAPTGSAFGTSSISDRTSQKEDPATSLLGTKKDEPTTGLFGDKKDEPSTGMFGAPKEGFSLGPSWKNPNAGKPEPKADESSDARASFFGGDFGNSLADDKTEPVSKEAEMSDNDDGNEFNSPPRTVPQSTTPAATPDPAKFFSAPPASAGLFGTQSQSNTTPAAVQNSVPINSIFGPPTPSSKPSTPSVPIIKEEPKDFDDAPLPPDITSKTSYTPGTSSTSSMAANDAPMPPDFLKSKPQANKFDDTPLPPDFAKPIEKEEPRPSKFDDAPLPPDFVTKRAPKSISSSEGQDESQALPEDDEGEDEGLDDEGSGIDVAQEMSPTSEQSQKVTPESSFGQKFDKSPLGGSFTNISQPAPRQPPKTLFGEIGKQPAPAPFFPPPSKAQQSPRSPSPIRRTIGGDMLRPDSLRSVSAPGVPLRQDTRKVTLGRPTKNAVYPPQASAEQLQREERERVNRQRAKMQAEEEQELSDNDDERAQEELAADVEATLTLDEFIAHQNYVGNITKPGIPGQIEKVYRDINSMIDTLGLNSRSLKAFIKGHDELYQDHGRERSDLENDDWCLSEIGALEAIEKTLEEDLDAVRLTDVQEKIDSLKRLDKEMAKIKAKQADLKRTVDAKLDPELIESLRNAPLSTEQSAMRYDLRREYTDFQKTLAQSEEALSMLRAKLVTHTGASKKVNGSQKVPTVEAIEKTILKMTSMAEKKSGDIDVLETQLKKLDFHSTASSRECSPFVTPPTSTMKGRAAVRTPGSSVNGNGFYTPKSARSLFNSSVASNRSDLGRSVGKKMSEVTEDDASRYAKKATRRKQIHGLLKEALVTGEVRIRTLDDL